MQGALVNQLQVSFEDRLQLAGLAFAFGFQGVLKPLTLVVEDDPVAFTPLVERCHVGALSLP